MHGGIDALVQECFFDFFREQALAADLGEWAVLYLIAGGFDHHDLDRVLGGQSGMSGGKTRAQLACLSQRQGTAPRTKAKGCLHAHAQSITAWAPGVQG